MLKVLKDAGFECTLLALCVEERTFLVRSAQSESVLSFIAMVGYGSGSGLVSGLGPAVLLTKKDRTRSSRLRFPTRSGYDFIV